MAVSDFQQAVEAWQIAYRKFFSALDRLPYNRRREAGLCGTWSAKEVVAHMAGWHQIALARFDAIEDDDPANLIDHYTEAEIDAINAENVAARRHLDWAQTVAELRVRMAALEERAHSLIVRRGADDPRYAAWMHGLVDDAEDHIPQIEAWVSGEE